MTALRILNCVVWLAVFVYMTGGAWSAASGRNLRRGDPMRLACCATAFVMIGFNLRWLIAADNMALWRALYVLSAALAIYIIMLGRAYGRGPRV